MRPTPLTRGSRAGLSSRRFRGPAAASWWRAESADTCSDLQLGRAADEVRDQPLAVDLGDVEIAGRERGDLASVDIDEVTFEVERAAVSIDGNRELVGGVVGQPVRPRLPRLGLQPDVSDLVFPRHCLSGPEGACRMVGEQAGHLVDVLLRDSLVERPLDLADFVNGRLLLRGPLRSRAPARASAGRKREHEDPDANEYR